jgi:transcriptional regulator
LHVHDDYDWVFSQAKDLTAQFEESRDVPWKLAESDENYVEKLARGIVGIEITVRAITGKYKLSQNRPDEDRENVMRSLEEGGMRDQVTARYMRDSL